MLLPPGKHAGDRGLRPSGREQEEDDSPSLSLWVGNLSTDTVDSELGALFGKFGVLDSVTTYAARNYAFVNFKRLDDAKMAKGALQGSIVRGNAIKIEFSRPARPGKNLWVGGICPSISKEQLESEFSKFGQIEDFKFLRDRNSALISFYKVDDAISALKNMNGKHFGGEQLRVDYLRSQPPRRDWVDHHHDPRDHPTWIPPEPMGNFPRFPPPIGRRDIQSKILWIGYPPSVQIDEQMLHNAMILFGEIDHIQCFPLKHYSIVEFRSVDEARRAKEGLQGRLFNDPRIQILFSTGGDFAYSGEGRFFPPVPPPRPDFFFHGRPMGGFPRGMMMHGGLGPVDLPPPPPPEFFRRFSPPSGRPVPGMWEEMDGREGKRMRRMGDPMVEEVPRSVVGGGMPGDSGYGSGDRQSPIVVRRPPAGGGGAATAPEHIWRGVIAKGGTPVCSARCLPLGKGIESPFPETVNCTAKTGLDTLAKHCAEASGFDTVFFLPDSEEDFSPYTEFLQYLGQNNRAGVAKLADGATMFLVPPSSFLSDFLSLSSPNRLYGIVLNLPLPPPPPPPVSTSKPADMALTPELIATLTALIPAASAALTSAKPVAQVQSTVGFSGQREMEDEKIQRYQSIPKSAAGYAGQRGTEDEKNQWYQSLLKSTVGSVGQRETEDEKNSRYQSMPKSTMAYAGQRGTVDEKSQWYQALPKSMAGSTGQRGIIDDKNQRYQSLPKSTMGYAGQREIQDEKNHWYQGPPKSMVGPSGQRELDAEKNQMYWSMMKSTGGSDGQRETYNERNQWSTQKSTMGSSGQREIENVNSQRYLSTVGSSSQGESEDARNQWYQSMMKSTAGPAGQREAEDEKIQRYQSTMKSTDGPAGQREAEDEKLQRYQSTMKSTAGPAGQRESEHEYNQRNQPTLQSTVGSTGQQETEDEKNKRYQSTLQFAASLLLQIQKQQQSAKGGANQ